MPRARRHARHDEIECGEFVFLRTGVQYGDDGILNLRHFVPFQQETWTHDGTANHALSTQYDALTSRVMSRITASAGGAITSKMRKRIILPRDFGSFPGLGVSLAVQSSVSIPTAYTLSAFMDGVADGVLNAASIKPTLGGTYETMVSEFGSDYAAGNLVTLEVALTTANNGEWAELGDIEIAYLTGRGNV